MVENRRLTSDEVFQACWPTEPEHTTGDLERQNPQIFTVEVNDQDTPYAQIYKGRYFVRVHNSRLFDPFAEYRVLPRLEWMQVIDDDIFHLYKRYVEGKGQNPTLLKQASRLY